jgi:hypothetical protein
VTPRIGILVGLVAGVALVIAIVILALSRAGPATLTPSPTPTATAGVTPTGTSSPTAAAASSSPSITASSPPGGVRFVNAQLGYSIDLPPPWRRSDCSPTEIDNFVVVPEYDEAGGDVGWSHDHVTVFAQPNPDQLTPREWQQSGRLGGELGESLVDVTFAGRPALRIEQRDSETYVVAKDDLLFQVRHGRATTGERPGETTPEERIAVVSSFRFLSEEERRALPSPTPLPPRTPEEVADVLAEGFSKKDVGILGTVIRPCIKQGQSGGGLSSMDDERYLDQLRERLARGLEVMVRPRPVKGDRTADFPRVVIGSTWREPGQPDLEVDLAILPEGERWYWEGTIRVVP